LDLFVVSRVGTPAQRDFSGFSKSEAQDGLVK
jgi:hypothetical protein